MGSDNIAEVQLHFPRKEKQKVRLPEGKIRVTT